MSVIYRMLVQRGYLKEAPDDSSMGALAKEMVKAVAINEKHGIKPSTTIRSMAPIDICPPISTMENDI